MSRRRAVLCVATLTWVLLSSTGHAQPPTNPPPNPPPATNPPPLWGQIDAEDEVDGDDTRPPGEPPPVCTVPVPLRPANTTARGDGQFTYAYYDGLWWRYDPATGVTWLRVRDRCTYADGTVGDRTYWQRQTDPDPRVRIPGLVDEVTELVWAPRPLLNPPGNTGVVNLGMWLAVDAQPLVTATASASPTTWARVTATLQSTAFDMGNGDVVTCDGAGTPIPDSARDSVEESPDCGYTYDETPDGPYTITMTSTWIVEATTSEGHYERRDDIVLSTSVTYDVIEIQTVGTRG